MAFDKTYPVATTFLTILALLVSSKAFNSHIPRIYHDLNIPPQQQGPRPGPAQTSHVVGQGRQRVIMNSWLRDTLNSLGLDFIQEKLKYQPNLQSSTTNSESKTKSKHGTVIRTASKSYHGENCKPSSAGYTTRKESRSEIRITPDGVEGDYNHYRTIALSSTSDRAVSILTTDVMNLLREERGGKWSKVIDGDLGENIYVDGIDYTFFEIGKRYKFHKKNDEDGNKSGANGKDSVLKQEEGVVVEITERIEPCGNLCKLSYINDESLEPMKRFEGCKEFLLFLDEREGLRGWYGKVIGDGGLVRLGDQVSHLAVAAAAQ